MRHASANTTGTVSTTLTDLGCACATARQVARVLTQLYDSRLHDSGIEAPQFALLQTLDKEGPCRQTVLGRRYALDKTTVSRNLKLLERDGWIGFQPTKDKRERQVALTAEGRRRLALARPKWKRAQAEVRDMMTAEEWERMFQTFKTITQVALSLQSAPPSNTRRRRSLSR